MQAIRPGQLVQSELRAGQLLQPDVHAWRVQAANLREVMVMPDSVRWAGLPAGVRAAIKDHTGTVLADEPWGEGAGSSLRLSLCTETGDVFAKGAGPDDPPARHRQLDAGAALSPYVERIAPRLLWQVKRDGWSITGFEKLPGRPWADQKPGSPDIPAVIRTLRELAAIPAPGMLTGTARDHWGQYADDPAVLDGDDLQHRDPNPANFVVLGQRAWLVDWKWAVRGPGWLTAALLVVSLMEGGWEADAAERAVATLPAWPAAGPRVLAGFAAAHARMWDESAAQAPDSKVRQFRAGIARQWADHRAALTRARM
jgi:hypothetical protein